MGSLADYAWSGSARLDSAYALQQTLWWLQGFGIQPTNPFSQAVLAHFGTYEIARGGSATEWGVYAVDLYTRDADAQDMLVFVPDGGTTLMLLGGALMGIGALRRKMRR